MDSFKSMAVLIDADNVSHKSINAILDELKSKGNIVIKRAYGSINKLKECEDECVKNAINISSHFNNVKGKNVSDFNLIIEAMDILYTRNVDTFVIVSSDSDFTGLIARLKESNKKVIGVGKSDAPQSLKNACNDFIFIENLNKKGIETNLETIKECKLDTLCIFSGKLVSLQGLETISTLVILALHNSKIRSVAEINKLTSLKILEIEILRIV